MKKNPIKVLTEENVQRLFSSEQRNLWPRAYRPSASVAFFLRPPGAALGDLITARKDLAPQVGQDEENMNDSDHDADFHRDIYSNTIRWQDASFKDFFEGFDVGDVEKSRRLRLLRRFSARDRIVSLHDICELFQIPHDGQLMIDDISCDPPLPTVRSSAATNPHVQVRMGRSPTESPKAIRPSESPHVAVRSPYTFSSYAKLQEASLKPLIGCRSLDDHVPLKTFPELNSLLNMEYRSLGPLQCLSRWSKDTLILSQEFISELAMYLASRCAEIAKQGECGPILCPFGNGRLAHFLNETNVIPVSVIATNMHASEKYIPAISTTAPISEFKLHDAFDTVRFDVQGSTSVEEALGQYKPSIVLAEPHSSRDFGAEIRGYRSVREVVFIGPVDGPAMGSFSYPWLTFGVSAGDDTFHLYSDKFQKKNVSKMQMPVDPPYWVQGYRRFFIDRVSSVTILPEDSTDMPKQGRCLSFRRV